ncbi:MAG TPA: superoxide dismutase [Burkholderiales bacterium]|nr:superoxide dismutase [Burkholderiales bacterium]
MATATAKAADKLHLQLPPLPFPEDALAPVISAETVRFHYGKHHRKYVETANQMLEQQHVQAQTLEELVRSSTGKLFNNAGQVWNHNFYWQSLSPRPGKPGGALRSQLERDFGSYEAFVDKFSAAAIGQFGSGWAWLVQKDGKLEVLATPNAESPMAKGIRCLLTVDVWEHAYYIDYRNERDRYVKALIEQRLNWEFAERNLTAR